MTDLVPLGNGNSRFLKSSISSDITFTQMVEMLRNGTFPIDFNGINPSGIAQDGTPINKSTMLTDETEEAIWGDAQNRTVDEALAFSSGVIQYTLNAKTERITLEDQMQEHYNYAAATDGNGNVFFAGGSPSYSALVDIYNTDGVRSNGTALSRGRVEMAAATDGSGCVLFGGGETSSSKSAKYSTAVDKYALDGTRTTLTALSLGRYGLAAATDGNGNVLFAGGSSYSTSGVVVDKYDTAGIRTTLESLSEPTARLAAATDGNGNVLFGGGMYDSYRSAVNKYDMSGTRSTLTPLSVARGFLAAATDGNGCVLFGGGSNSSVSAVVDKYDTSGTRTTLEPLSEARHSLAASTDGNGNVMFGGGIASNGSNGSVKSATVEQYDVNGNQTVLEPLSVGRDSLAAAADGNGDVLFGGGLIASGAVYNVDKYSINGRPVEITIVPGSRYKFKEHGEEQQSGLTQKTITVPRPNKGYVRIGGHIID